jgi:hypothetical protein
VEQSNYEIYEEYKKLHHATSGSLDRLWTVSSSSVLERAISNHWNGNRFYTALSQTSYIIEELNYLLNTEKDFVSWSHQRDLDAFSQASKSAPFPKEELARLATSYIASQDIQSNTLDWIFMDMLIYVELHAYAYHLMVKDCGTKTINLSFVMSNGSLLKFSILKTIFPILKFFLVVVVPLGGAFFLHVKFDSFWIALAFASYAIIRFVIGIVRIPIFWKMRSKSIKLYQEILKVYAHFEGRVISPTILKKELDQSRDEGVIFDSQLHILVDLMVARDPVSFIASKQ